MRRLPIAMTLCALALALGAAGLAKAQAGPAPASKSTTARDQRWAASLDAFEAADRSHATPPGGVLFVGSSSIRLWDELESDFAGLPVVLRRGFGGSRMSDCARYLDRLVVRYRPRVVVVYAGDNDLAEGATPAEVLASFVSFVEGVRRELPDTRIAYVSIKPSPVRAALIPLVRETNERVAQYVASQPGLDYIDVFSRMLGPDGQPRRELFGPDALHLNRSGYALWRSVIAPHLETAAPVTSSAR